MLKQTYPFFADHEAATASRTIPAPAGTERGGWARAGAAGVGSDLSDASLVWPDQWTVQVQVCDTPLATHPHR